MNAKYSSKKHGEKLFQFEFTAAAAAAVFVVGKCRYVVGTALKRHRPSDELIVSPHAAGSGESCSTEGELRLADGVSANEGRVEVCVSGLWGTVCDHSFGVAEAHVVCNQLGLPAECEYALYMRHNTVPRRGEGL